MQLKQLIQYVCSFSLVLVYWASWAIELPLVIIVPAYNNAAYVQATLNSIAMQQYDNYRIIYIDDCSNDGSPALVQEFINTHQWNDRVTFIQNHKRYRKMRNVYYAINYLCDDDEIIVFIDCDDLLAHDQVFSLINNVFSNPDVWFMYGNDKAYPESEVAKWGISKTNLCSPVSAQTIEKNSFRSSEFVYMHIRAFRSWLYKSVKIEDLLADKVPGYQGLFYPACNDYANIYPMLEMAGKHIYFNPELVYLYNAGSPLNGFKIDRSIMIASGQEIKTKKTYQPLMAPTPYRLNNYNHATADLIIFSSKPDETKRLIIQTQNLAQQVESRIIMYRPDITTIDQYDALAQEYPEYLWLNLHHHELKTALFHLQSKHCLLVDDSIHLDHMLNLTQGIIELERMNALCVNYGLTNQEKTGMRIQEITPQIKVFSCKHNQHIPHHSTHACLYRTNYLIETLFAISQNDLYSHIQIWQKMPAYKNVGIILN